jgi:predicted transcriptional regulator
MKKTNKKNILPLHQKRLKLTASMLREMRFSESKNQDGFIDYGVSRRQVQRGEKGCNISLITLFKLIDVYGYRLGEFFEGME